MRVEVADALDLYGKWESSVKLNGSRARDLSDSFNTLMGDISHVSRFPRLCSELIQQLSCIERLAEIWSTLTKLEQEYLINMTKEAPFNRFVVLEDGSMAIPGYRIVREDHD